MLRRVLTVLVLLTLGAVLAAGCGPKEEDATAKPPGATNGPMTGNAPTATTTVPLHQ